MGRQKITLLELGDRLRAGKTDQEIGAEFRMSARAVRKRKAGLNLQVSKSAALYQAKVILAQQIDANAQLLKINESVNSTLALLEARIQDKAGGLNHTVVDQQLKAIAEVRKQLELLAKVAADWLEAKRLAAVYQVLITEIGAESAECKARIIRRLGGLQSSGLLFAVDGWT